MLSKLVLILALLIGAFLTYFCVDNNKFKLSNKYAPTPKVVEKQENITTTATPEEKEVVVKEENFQEEKNETETIVKPTPTPVVKEKQKPYFIYSSEEKTKLNLKLSTSDKVPALENFILENCPADSCTQELSFDENTDDAKWLKEVITISQFLKDKRAKNSLVSMDNGKLKIKGELSSDDDLSKLNDNLKNFDNSKYSIENLVTVTKKEAVIEPVTKSKIKIDTQAEISELLKTNPIYFEHNSANITNESKATLDKILNLLKTNVSDLKVEGHTDSIGKASYNKYLSQKRADSVKKYLQTVGNYKGNIEAIGYGEEQPISNNTRDKINRRVEIYLKKGE